MNPSLAWLSRTALFLLVALGAGASLAGDPGRLFYTPAQRAQLEADGVGKLFGPGTPTTEIIDYIRSWAASRSE